MADHSSFHQYFDRSAQLGDRERRRVPGRVVAHRLKLAG